MEHFWICFAIFSLIVLTLAIAVRSQPLSRWINVLLTIATIGVLVRQTEFAGTQNEIVNRQLASDKMAQRPFVYFPGNTHPRLAPTNLNILFADLENQGHSFATDIQVGGRIVAHLMSSLGTEFGTSIKDSPCRSGIVIPSPELAIKPGASLPNFAFSIEAGGATLARARGRDGSPYLEGCISYTWTPIPTDRFHTFFFMPVVIVDGNGHDVSALQNGGTNIDPNTLHLQIRDNATVTYVNVD
jgi:hypothetical protein